MSTATKAPYADALAVAQSLTERLRPGVARGLIAGSLRRRKVEIGDVELVVIPKTEPVADLFGDLVGQRSLLDDVLADLDLHYTKNGERYKQFVWQDMPVDLFIATPETWGCVATIRTGSADFSKWLVTARKYGGACPSHLRFNEGRIWDGGTALATPEEQAVFDALGVPWVKPIDRIGGQWSRADANVH